MRQSLQDNVTALSLLTLQRVNVATPVKEKRGESIARNAKRWTQKSRDVPKDTDNRENNVSVRIKNLFPLNMLKFSAG